MNNLFFLELCFVEYIYEYKCPTRYCNGIYGLKYAEYELLCTEENIPRPMIHIDTLIIPVVINIAGKLDKTTNTFHETQKFEYYCDYKLCNSRNNTYKTRDIIKDQYDLSPIRNALNDTYKELTTTIKPTYTTTTKQTFTTATTKQTFTTTTTTTTKPTYTTTTKQTYTSTSILTSLTNPILATSLLTDTVSENYDLSTKIISTKSSSVPLNLIITTQALPINLQETSVPTVSSLSHLKSSIKPLSHSENSIQNQTSTSNKVPLWTKNSELSTSIELEVQSSGGVGRVWVKMSVWVWVWVWVLEVRILDLV
jgi:hypothetical protein